MRWSAVAFAQACWDILKDRVQDFANPEPDLKSDATGDDRKSVMARLRAAADSTLRDSEARIGGASDRSGTRLIDHSQREFKRLQINLIKDEPKFGGLLTKWRKQNVSLIKSMQADRLSRVEELLKNNAGMRVETLTKALQEQFDDVTPRQAELIARDQTLKLNAQVTQERHAAAGITEFFWTTSNDERVRASHRALDGKRFEYAEPPLVDGRRLLPGEDYQCRCIPFPILPELS